MRNFFRFRCNNTLNKRRKRRFFLFFLERRYEFLRHFYNIQFFFFFCDKRRRWTFSEHVLGYFLFYDFSCSKFQKAQKLKSLNFVHFPKIDQKLTYIFKFVISLEWCLLPTKVYSIPKYNFKGNSKAQSVFYIYNWNVEKKIPHRIEIKVKS